MAETWVRGNFFMQALDHVKRKWGQTGLDKINECHENYLPERTYPFEDFCALLSKISSALGEDTISDYSKLGGDMVRNDERWRQMFRGMDPRGVFSTTKRQDGRYQVAFIEVESDDVGEVRLNMRIDIGKKELQDMWAEFYKGRLEAVLELTGYKGFVEMARGKKGGAYSYIITWEAELA
jgi:uncharacterized protein (TIGR02265 family)